MKIIPLTGRLSLKRSLEQGTDEQRRIVIDIIEAVKRDGDEALARYTKQFDGVELGSLRVTADEFAQAERALSDEHKAIIAEAAANIRAFHEQDKAQSWMTFQPNGTMLGKRVTPLDAVGLYVPGGTAAYPSSVLMNVIPAQVAGVERIVITSPPQRDGKLPDGVLYAAQLLGIEEVYKVGGAQAIAALAFGTETIAPVDKITGPGNIFVALAKREVFGHVAIDMIAGPSEIVVLADETANGAEVAADLLSQAEHDVRASAIVVTTSQALAEEIVEEVERQVATLPRADIARAALRDYGAIYFAPTMKDAVEAVNQLAPEHLEIMTSNPLETAATIRHAGAIFLGRYSSEPIGDYFAGPNHVLPTNGTARFSSPLSVDDFVKKTSLIMYSEQALYDNAAKIASFARLEQLEAHARAVEIRQKELSNATRND